MIKVLIVEDSPVVQEFLIHILSSDEELTVIGKAGNGEEAIEALNQRKPDIILMDIHMPKMDGLTATRQIMETNPVPIVIVSGSTQTHEMANTFHALEAGALALVRRPVGIGHSDHPKMREELIQTLKLMSEIKVVRRRPSLWKPAAPIAAPLPKVEAPIQLVAIGASTGGPPVLQTILSRLPKNFPSPIAIVQHMASGFSEGFVEWLGQSTGFPTRLASQGEWLAPAQAYVAPYGFQMKIKRENQIELTADGPENGHCPSVSYFFRSVADHYEKNAVGVLLTGMGVDGARELKLMKEKGAVTLAQDKESSVVYGMPGEAARLDGATLILPPEKMAEVLESLVNLRRNRGASYENPKLK